MISVTSITDRYILQPSLLAKHKATLEWISTLSFMRRELAFFQRLLDKYGPQYDTPEEKQEASRYQNLITYYNGQLLNTLATKLRLHEKDLAEMLAHRDELKTDYFKEHDTLMGELDALYKQFLSYKESFFSFIEKQMPQK